MIIYQEVCNGCGTWNSENRATFNTLKLDMTNYVLFSTGFKLKSPEVEIKMCNKCYSEARELEIYSAGGELDRLRKVIDTKEKEIKESKKELRYLKQTVKRLLEPLDD